ncbi:MAG: NADH-quinone oxidoreductase subunit N [Pseudomonadales bacterium]
MSASAFYVLAPYLALTGALVVLLLVIAFARSHLTALVVTVLGLVATVVVSIVTADAEPQIVMSLLQIDGYTSFYNLLFLLAALATCLLAFHYLKGRRGELEEFYVLINVGTLGAMIMAGAVHFATFVLGLEILSVALYAMIAYPEEKHPPLEAALKYLVLSAVASTTMLFGMALIYNATGSLYFSDLGEVESAKLTMHLRVGQAMLFAGIAFKLSLVPFHMWTPDVYQGAPAPVTGYIATVSKAAVFAMLMRLAIESDALTGPVVFTFMSLLAVGSMIVGNLLALRQDNLKRLLAYSSIAHMGYLLVALIGTARLADEPFVAEAAMVYLAGYTLTTLAAFGVVALLSSAPAGDDAQTTGQYRGLFWRRPIAAACLTAALLSLMGMPLTAGFIAKFYIVATGVQGAMWVLVWALIIGSSISVYYYVKVIYAMTSTETAAPYPSPQTSGASLPTVLALSVGVVAVGFYPTPLINVIRSLVGDFGL